MEDVYRIDEETADENYVVIEEGKIKRVCVVSNDSYCRCEYDYVCRDCKYDCVRSLAERMTSDDKNIVLAAVKKSEEKDIEDSIGNDSVWKRVSPKSLPENKENLLIAVAMSNNSPKEVLAYAKYDMETWSFKIPFKGDAKRFGWSSVFGKVTHWMPMPVPPA